MNKLCIILNKDDIKWAKKVIQKNVNKKNFIVLAPTFEGMVGIKEFCRDYIGCEDIASKINKFHLYEKANKLVGILFGLYEKKIYSHIPKSSLLKKYPIFKMHYLHFVYFIFEILNSWTYASKIIKKYNPSEIYIRIDNKIYTKEDKYLSYYSYENNSLSLCFEELSLLNRIKINKYNINKNSSYNYFKKTKSLIKILYFFIYKNFLNNSLYFFLNLINYLSNSLIPKKKINYKKLIFNCESGYYFKMIAKDILRLSKKKYFIYINFLNAPPGAKELLKINQSNIRFMYNFTPNYLFTFFNPNKISKEDKILNKIFYLFYNHFKQNNFYIKKNFSFKKIFLRALKKEISFFMPRTISLLSIYEKRYSSLKLDLAFNHFDSSPFEQALIFPLKKRKIITVSSSHGMSTATFFREAYSSDYFLTTCKFYKELLQNVFNTRNIFLFNDNLYASFKYRFTKEKTDAKRFFNLDNKNPVIIFCDDSSFLFSGEYINSQFSNIKKIILLKEKIPNLQLIFRYHAGIDITYIKKYIKSFGYNDVYVQQHPNPHFYEFVKTADLVIAHRSSVIFESLSCGVPVVYLTAPNCVDPFLLGYKELKIIHNFDLLYNYVDNFFKNKALTKIIEIKKSNFLKDFHTQDKKKYLSKFIENVLKTENNLDNNNFFDWHKRINNTTNLKHNFLYKSPYKLITN
jgi:hypothetical protein